jgi:PAS domain S-box-containing protein
MSVHGQSQDEAKKLTRARGKRPKAMAGAISEAREQQADWFRVALTKIGDAVLVTDAGGRVTYMNPVAESLTGWPNREAIGQPLMHVFRIIHEHTRRPIEQSMPVLAREVKRGPTQHKFLVTRNGAEIPIDDSSAPIPDRAGGLAGFVLIFRDMSQSRRAERAAQDAHAYAEVIVDTVREPLVVLDAALRVRAANRSFYRTFQVAPEETEKQFLFRLGNHQWDIPRLRELLEEVYARDSQFNDFAVDHEFERIGRRTMLLNARRLDLHDGLILLAIEDITARKRAEQALREAHNRLEERVQKRTAELARANLALTIEIEGRQRAEAAHQQLALRLASAQEEYRRRIARELHDEMGQHLTALSLGLKSLKDTAPELAAARQRLQQLQELADLMGKQIHQLALELRPAALDDLGLHTALVNYIEAWSQRSGVEVDWHSAGLEGARLPPVLETTLYRVVQEALTNVLKHARAKHVSLILQRGPKQVVLVIEDDGCGFEAEAVLKAARRLGLLGMQERLTLVQGTLTIESTPGCGTTIFARIPLPVGRGDNLE